MEDGLASLRAHGTWQLVALAKAKKQAVITNRWAFVVKRDAQGPIERFNARLAIHGFKQKYGVDYVETFAPVIRYDTIRASIMYAVKRGWLVLQYDIKTAFLYGQLTELIFMEQPVCFEENGRQLVCQLVKSLYGLKQAPAVWNKTLHTHLEKLGFTRLDSDYGLYAKFDSDGEMQMLLTVYVDDLLLMVPSDLCTEVANQLKDVFTLTSMGEVKFLLGIEITIDRTHNKIMYCQRAHIDKILKAYGMQDAYECWTPQSTSESKTKLKPLAPDTRLPYREIVG
ncbi:Gag-pol Polyprotein, partial [Phytophthora megakarya]